MKHRALIICVVFILILMISGAVAEDIRGSWAYIHAPEEAALILNDDGSAVLDGERFSYTLSDGYISLDDGKGETRNLRYVMDGENMLLYKKAEYAYQGSGEPKGLIGVWKGTSGTSADWSYQFTDKGTFLEDGYFPGYYTVDEAGKSFKLVYVDQFADTVCYYEIEGRILTVDYPWTMVRVVRRAG